MKRALIGFLTAISVTGTAMAHGDQPGVVSIGKATELGAHRIERLVALKKIDVSFRTALISMRAERTSEMGARYKIYGYVAPDANKKSSTIAMLVDQKGKVLSHSVGPIAKPVNPTVWPEKDALTLTENALHFVLDGSAQGSAQSADLKPFNNGLLTLSLSPGKDAGGKTLAIAALTSDDDKRTLFISLKTDGNVLSYEIK